MNEVCGMISPVGNDEQEQPATIEQLTNPASHYKACRMPLSGGLATAGAVSLRGNGPGPSRSNPTVHVLRMWKSLQFPYKGWASAPSQVETALHKK